MENTPSIANRRAIIHIGMHKTGTTAIQRFIGSEADALRTAGIHYQIKDIPAEASHNNAQQYIAWHLLGWDDFMLNNGYDQAFISSIKTRLRNHSDNHTLLLSTENFDRLSLPQIKALAEMLAGYECKVIVYVRRQDDFIQALYQTQVIHFNHKQPISELLNDERLDYNRLANIWAHVFGKGNIIVRPYENEQLVAGNTVADFVHVLHTLGHEIQAAIPETRLNAGYPSGYVELMRQLSINATTPDLFWQQAKKLGRKLYRLGAGEYWFLKPSERRALIARYSESNAMLAREYLGRADGRLFYNLEVPWDDEAWEKMFGSQDLLMAAFFEDMYQALDARKPGNMQSAFPVGKNSGPRFF